MLMLVLLCFDRLKGRERKREREKEREKERERKSERIEREVRGGGWSMNFVHENNLQ